MNASQTYPAHTSPTLPELLWLQNSFSVCTFYRISKIATDLLFWHLSNCNQSRLTFWYRSLTFNSNKSQTWCNNFSVYYPDVCLQLNMFRAFSRPSSGAQWLQWQPPVLSPYRGDSRAVFVVGPPGPTTTDSTATNGKPEAATAVIELLMMDGRTPETCWAANKRQDNKLENCCIRFVIYLNCTMMQGLANFKSLFCGLIWNVLEELECWLF